MSALIYANALGSNRFVIIRYTIRYHAILPGRCFILPLKNIESAVNGYKCMEPNPRPNPPDDLRIHIQPS